MEITKPLQATIDIQELLRIAENANDTLQKKRLKMLAPELQKLPPVYNTLQLAELCGIDKAKVMYERKKGELPPGIKEGTRLEWTLVQTRQWVQYFRDIHMRDRNKTAAAVITVANFKGGVAKTSTAAALAQGLNLRGHRVLVVDTDPQGSLTTLFGVMPDTEVEEDQTILPLCMGEADSIMSAIQPTYWDGIDLVAAAPVLYNAEFILPTRQRDESGFEFWTVLSNGLEPACEVYDFIIIDTPPSLSYVTINAIMAANGIIMPLPPSALDFASSTQFWNLFTDVCSRLLKASDSAKKFYFIDILLSRVDKADIISNEVRQWIMTAYPGMVLPVEIPKTSIAATASADFGTVYDMDPLTTNAKTLKRARDAYDQLADYIEIQAKGIWSNDVLAGGKP